MAMDKIELGMERLKIKPDYQLTCPNLGTQPPQPCFILITGSSYDKLLTKFCSNLFFELQHFAIVNARVCRAEERSRLIQNILGQLGNANQ